MRLGCFVILGFLVLAGQNGFAADVQYEVGGGYDFFAGDNLQSLAPQTGYLLRFGAEAGRHSILKWMSCLNLLESQGTSNFNDAGTSRSLGYTLVAGEFELGAKLAFLAGDDRLPIQPYIGGAGAAMSASFSFPAGSTVSSTFPLTEAQNFYGYSIFVGADIETGRDWGLNVEVDQIILGGTVANNPFSLNSNRVFLNVFFRR